MWSGKIGVIVLGGFALGTLLEFMSFEGILWVQVIILSAAICSVGILVFLSYKQLRQAFIPAGS